MNSENIWLKFAVILIILMMGGASYFLYKFLYDENNEFIRNPFTAVPVLDIESYDRLIKSGETTEP